MHRSFQEYFAALFALNFSGAKKYEVMDKIISVSESAVVKMMMELDSIRTKRYWLLLKLEYMTKYFKNIKRRKTLGQWEAFFHTIYVEEDDDRSGFSLTPEGSRLISLFEIFSECGGDRAGFVDFIDNLVIPKESAFLKVCKPIQFDRSLSRDKKNSKLYIRARTLTNIIAQLNTSFHRWEWIIASESYRKN